MENYKNISFSSDAASAKDVLAYFLIILYFFATFKPLMPLISDALAHSFWEANHHKIVHQLHGSQHVHSEIAQTEQEDENRKNTNKKFSDPVAIHTASNILYNFPFYSYKEQTNYPFLFFVPTLHSDVYYPPPKSWLSSTLFINI